MVQFFFVAVSKLFFFFFLNQAERQPGQSRCWKYSAVGGASYEMSHKIKALRFVRLSKPHQQHDIFTAPECCWHEIEHVALWPDNSGDLMS